MPAVAAACGQRSPPLPAWRPPLCWTPIWGWGLCQRPMWQRQWQQQLQPHTNVTGRHCCLAGALLCLRRVRCSGHMQCRPQGQQQQQQQHMLVKQPRPQHVGMAPLGLNTPGHQEEQQQGTHWQVQQPQQLCQAEAIALQPVPGKQPIAAAAAAVKPHSSKAHMEQQHPQSQPLQQLSSCLVLACSYSSAGSSTHSYFMLRFLPALSGMWLSGALCCHQPAWQVAHQSSHHTGSAPAHRPASSHPWQQQQLQHWHERLGERWVPLLHRRHC